MSSLVHALELAAAGFHVFPMHAGTKKPCITGFPHLASANPRQIEDWAYQWPGANWGISTTMYNGGEWHLIGVDVDVKNGRDGRNTLLIWDCDGRELPPTYTQSSPSGGRHLVYKSRVLVPNSVEKLGEGIDIRGKGGLLAGRGSITPAGEYDGDLSVPVAEAPAWLATACGEAATAPAAPAAPPPAAVSSRAAKDQARAFLAACPVATSGGRDNAAFKAAAHVKDLGVNQSDCEELMTSVWLLNCTPALSWGEVARVVNSAYTYGLAPAGAAAPEVEFPIVAPAAAAPPETPEGIEKMNEEFAYALTGSNGNVLWFTTDENDQPVTRFLAKDTFHDLTSGRKVLVQEKPVPLSRIWMQSRNRRTFQGVVFSPERAVGERFYNLWRGFAVAPSASGPPEAQASLDAFLEHVHRNVCGSDTVLSQWILGYFAHLIQKPWEKPLTALVFRGDKGVGKDTMMDIVGHLLGDSYLNTAQRRHILGDFNSLLENKLLIVLNEAFWAHDKQVDGVLKHLITHKDNRIERKGQEPYAVRNLLRIAVMGNEDIIIPATPGERRYAAFQVDLKTHTALTKEARSFFLGMRKGMEAGGYSMLLHYLQQFDLSKVDVDGAPDTELLHEQKVGGLDPALDWWKESLDEGRPVATDFPAGGWPTEMDKDAVRVALHRYRRERNITRWDPKMIAVGKMLKKAVPSMVTNQKRREGKATVPVYRFPELEICRAEWDKFIGHAGVWE